MRTAPCAVLMLAALGTISVGCGNDVGPADGGTDAGADAGADGGRKDGGLLDGGRDASTDAGHTEAYGFQLRVPETRIVPCSGNTGGSFCPDGTVEFLDRDYVCTLHYQDLDAYVYVQATPTEYVDFIGPTFETVGAWISDGVTAEAVTASYSWGGGHHNEAIVLDLAEQRFQYWHSSFGFGFRACHPPDCLDVYQPGSSDLVESGCSPERSLPVVCVAVDESGAPPPLVDTFEKCLGDD